jgi:hypothetical protein
MEKRTACPTVPVQERVDRLKLGVRDGSMSEDRNVVAPDESNEIVDGVGHQSVVWGDEHSPVRTEVTTADPYLLVPKPAQFLRAVLDQQGIVHLDDGLPIDLISQGNRRPHGLRIGHNQRCVSCVQGM